MQNIKNLILSHWGSTMIELMAVLAIMGLGIAALLQTIAGWLYYAKDTENNIKAINLAREGIEWMINIRDTNWLRFSSDKANCWKVKDYKAACIGNSSLLPYPTDPGIIASWSYTIFSQNGAWFLSGATVDPSWDIYKNNFSVGIDSAGFYTQTGIVNTPCSSFLQSSCKTVFAREIQIAYTAAQTGSMQVTSTVKWLDRRPQSVVIDTVLTNWKSNF
jgi:type II secretory pathway pseudopilin PulG